MWIPLDLREEEQNHEKATRISTGIAGTGALPTPECGPCHLPLPRSHLALSDFGWTLAWPKSGPMVQPPSGLWRGPWAGLWCGLWCEWQKSSARCQSVWPLRSSDHPANYPALIVLKPMPARTAYSLLKGQDWEAGEPAPPSFSARAVATAGQNLRSPPERQAERQWEARHWAPPINQLNLGRRQAGHPT